MGPLVKYTDRLILRVEDEHMANQVLALYERNREAFEMFEPTRPKDFYTVAFHKAVLKREYKSYSLGCFLRYYIYPKANSKLIIGAINFNLFNDGYQRTAEIGYKLDTAYQHQGIAYEACLAAMEIIKNEYNVTRIDARIHPENAASIKLATKLGFSPNSYEPQSANVLGRYVDIIRYSIDI